MNALVLNASAATGRRLRNPVAIILAALLAGCFDGGGDPPATQIDNSPPVANAGADQTVLAQTVVGLNGGASSDPDGDIIRYRWTLTNRPTGSTAALGGDETATPSFTPDRPGTYLVTLEASDGFEGSSDTDTVTITATTPPPVANAGPDQSRQFSAPGITVQLTGTGSSDPGSLPLTYAWVITSFVPSSGLPPATPAGLVAPATVNPTLPITAGDQIGTYTLTLTVGNGAATASDTVVVSVASIPPPAANAGPDQEVVFPVGGVTVQLDGTGSSDPGSLPLTYAWQIVAFTPSGGNSPVLPAALVGANTATPTFDVSAPDQLGTYTVRLTVDNGTVPASDEVTIVVAKSFPAAFGLLGSAMLAGLGAAFRRRLRTAGAQAAATLRRVLVRG